MKPFRIWMLKASTAEQKRLAWMAGVSHGYLYQLAAGERDAMSDTAGRIAKSAELIRAKSKTNLPAITRADISSVCWGCDYARRCTKRVK